METNINNSGIPISDQSLQIEKLKEVLRSVETWWLEQGRHESAVGAPNCIFQVRAALVSEDVSTINLSERVEELEMALKPFAIQLDLNIAQKDLVPIQASLLRNAYAVYYNIYKRG
jgi:hypothetical protein